MLLVLEVESLQSYRQAQGRPGISIHPINQPKRNYHNYGLIEKYTPILTLLWLGSSTTCQPIYDDLSVGSGIECDDEVHQLTRQHTTVNVADAVHHHLRIVAQSTEKEPLWILQRDAAGAGVVIGKLTSYWAAKPS